jgi:hypothetical protein
MPSKKQKKVTPDRVEDVKTRHGFDLHLAKAIMPPGRRERILREAVLSEQVVGAIRETIDGHLTVFIAAGAKKVPASVYDVKPQRRRRRFSPSEDLTNLLRRFLRKCFDELHGRKLTRAEERAYANKARVLIIAVVERSPKLSGFLS